MNLLPKIFPRTSQERQVEFERQLIKNEAEIGGKLFGPVAKGHNRQFFCLDEHTWIWHEEWTQDGKRHVVTTRYEIRNNNVIKVQNGHTTRLTHNEALHLYKAVDLYYKKVGTSYQMMLAAA